MIQNTAMAAVTARIGARCSSSRVGVAHVFRSRALPRSEAMRVLEASTTRVFAVTRSARAAEVLSHLSRTRSRTAIVVLPKRLADEFVEMQTSETVPLTPAMLHSLASHLGEASNPGDETPSGCLVEVGGQLVRDGLCGSVGRPRWIAPHDSPDEPVLPRSDGHRAAEQVPATRSVSTSAVDVAVAELGAAVLSASEDGALEALLELLPPRPSSNAGGLGERALLAASRHPHSGATPLHLLAVAAAAIDVPACHGHDRGGIATAPNSAELASSQSSPSNATVHPLLAAAVRQLIDAGVDVNAAAANGSTALHWAAGAGNAGMVRLLLDCGADPYARSYTWRCV